MGLYQCAQAGDPEALAALVRRHIPLVHALSRRFADPEEAFQQGCLGLVHAIRRYREESGFQFSTYAVPVILGEMRRAFSRSLGWRTQKKINRIRRLREEICRSTGREPGIRDLAVQSGLPPEEMLFLWEREQRAVSVESSDALLFLPDPNSDGWLTRFFIRDILERMQRDERFLIVQRFVAGQSQTAIARALRISQSAASRKEKAARMHFRAAWMGDSFHS